MSRLDTAENSAKSNIQGGVIHLVKLNHNGMKSDRTSSGRILTGESSALPNDPEKGCADNQTIINVDIQIDELAVEKDMHERMIPEET